MLSAMRMSNNLPHGRMAAPIQKLKHKIDYEHYIDKQMRPIADSVLDFFDTTFDDVLKNSTQKTLDALMDLDLPGGVDISIKVE